MPATSSTVPANIPALFWRSQASFAPGAPQPTNPALVKLTTTADPTTPLPLTATLVQSTSFRTDWLLVPDQPLAAGTSYTLTDGNVCQSSFSDPPKSTFSAGPASALPTQLGALTLAPNEVGVHELATASGTCTSPATVVSARFQLELSADAAPWRDALHFETLVDDQPWTAGNFGASYRPPGSNGQGRGIDLVFRLCDTDDTNLVVMGLDGGVHLVTMRATLPGTNVTLATSPISVQLECPPPPPPMGADVTETSPADQAGCGCATSRASSIAPLLLALVTLRRITRRDPDRRG